MVFIPLERWMRVASRLAVADTEATKDTVLRPFAQQAVAGVRQATNAQNALTALHRLQRVSILATLGLGDHDAVGTLMAYPLWDSFEMLQASPEQHVILAKLLYEGDPDFRDPILFLMCDYARGVAELVLQRCLDNAAIVDPWIDDPLFHRSLLRICSVEQAAAYGALMARRRLDIGRIITMRINHTGDEEIPLPPENAKAYSNGVNSITADRNLFFTLTVLPTPDDADLDGIAYPDYVDLFFRMVTVDWVTIDAAHRVLIDKLNKGGILRITNSDGTDVSMDLTGFTFANSLVAKNIPGSEVFSAPRRDSVNGRIVAKGRFIPRGRNEVVENITLEFKEGRITAFHADTGLDILTEIIATDEGTRYIGEIGIGTNPVLKQHIVNSLMVEKIGGSFHVAIGAAYEFTDYLGTPVRVDNGNRSKVHWDITTMLFGKQGVMTLDGVVLMQDGKFTDPALSALNG